MEKPVLVAITGASGVILGIELLYLLKNNGTPVHLILSKAAVRVLNLETNLTLNILKSLVSKIYNFDDIGAAPASGSFCSLGMIIVPCSIKTLSAVANSYADNLIVRSADVHLKERKPLLLIVRETPLHNGHLKLMLKVSETGAIIMPPVPAFYTHPSSIQDITRYILIRAMKFFDIKIKLN